MRGRLALLFCILFLYSTAVPGAVQFTLDDGPLTSQTEAVYLAGSFNGWSTSNTPMKHQDDFWDVSLSLPDGRYYYKFVLVNRTGGPRWIFDPAHPFLADNAAFGANNVIDVVNGARVDPRAGMEHFWFRYEASWAAVAGDFNEWRLGQFPLYHNPAHPAEWQV